MCVSVCCICQCLRLHCSDERAAAGGLESTLYHVRAAGSRLTRCPGSWRLCPAACEWWWHKEGPAESAVCSLCLPFSFAHDFRLQKEAVRGSIMASGGWGPVPVPHFLPPYPPLPSLQKMVLLNSFLSFIRCCRLSLVLLFNKQVTVLTAQLYYFISPCHLFPLAVFQSPLLFCHIILSWVMIQRAGSSLSHVCCLYLLSLPSSFLYSCL